jgi:hypothetical protein
MPDRREERLLRNLPDRLEGGCWLWTGARQSAGYGNLKFDGEYVLAHRLAWETWVGPIPEGLVLDHVAERGCTSTACCNPAHLEPVPQRTNVLRGSGPMAMNARKTHCPNDHEYDRFYRRKDGRVMRSCSTCSNAKQNAKRDAGR